MRERTSRRSFLVPEVIQTSLMDCGPAALKAVLQGFGIAVDYDLLRERCQTDVDGTSIDALADLAGELGLGSQEILVPRDHFLLKEADCLPSIVVTRSGGGLLHFIVVWNTVGPYVQVMDPTGGRRWTRWDRFLATMPDIPIPISVDRWRRWACSENAVAPWRARMQAVGIGGAGSRSLIARAQADAGWVTFAALDAGIRMIASLVETGAIGKGREAERLLESLLDRTVTEGHSAEGIPRKFWWATPGTSPGKITIRGALIVRFFARTQAVALRSGSPLGGRPSRPPQSRCEPVSEKPDPVRLAARMIRLDVPRAIALVTTALLASAVVATMDAFLLRGVLDVSRYLALDYQRLGGIGVLFAFTAGGLLLEIFIAAVVHRLGIGLETRLRVALLEKLPRLDDRYLQSRPTSDMTSRAHAMQMLREAPALAVRIARAFFMLLATTIGIVWLYPRGAVLAALAAVLSFAVPYVLMRPLIESSMRMRTQAGALERFYLDSLLGVIPIRVHGAERSVRREHEDLLSEWSRTAQATHVQSMTIQTLQLVTSTVIVVMLLWNYVAGNGAVTGLLLLAFWALRVPAAGQDLVLALVAYRNVRNVAVRLIAPLTATEFAGHASPGTRTPKTAESRDGKEERIGVGVELQHVTVRASGRTLLRDVSLEIPPAKHVAIVGASGAGKSSLVALFLGWHTPSEGRILIDGDPLDAGRLVALREEVAWVDPAVQLWHRSLLDNVVFGERDEPLERLPAAMEQADLTEVLEGLADGMQTNLGEGGVRVSGGQGQRVRLARAFLRNKSRLVILDEPFRGLERERRRELLGRARERWKGATLLFVSHDVSDTFEFDRVLVVDGGTVVEDGAPSALMANEASVYRALVEADRALYADAWSHARWRHRRIEHGRLLERVTT
jgi:ATP-binding cassette subfamily B protein